MEPLEDAVEVVYLSRVVAVHVYRGVSRFHLQPERSLIAVAVTVSVSSVAAVPPRIVVTPVVAAESQAAVAPGIEATTVVAAVRDDHRRAAAPARPGRPRNRTSRRSAFARSAAPVDHVSAARCLGFRDTRRLAARSTLS